LTIQHNHDTKQSLIKPKVLLYAYYCVPGLGSVSQIGWEWYSGLARRVPTTLVTHIRNRNNLYAAGAPFNDSEIIFIDTEWFAIPMLRFLKKLRLLSPLVTYWLSSLDFYLYDWIASRQLKARQRAGEQWDIIHLVTPVTPRLATRLHILNLPLVLGPLNGGLTIPKAFPKIMKQYSGKFSHVIGGLHYVVTSLNHLFNFAWGGIRHASAILTATQATRETIPARYRSRCLFYLENGVDLNVFTPAPWPPSPQPLHIIYVGRLVEVKGVPMLLEAVAALKEKIPVKLTIIGSGYEEKAWKTQAKRLLLDDIIVWYGYTTASEVAEQLHTAHVLCLPSVRESGGAVLLEAMACARPVIAIAWGGPAELVDDNVGCAIPPKGVKAVTAALIDSLHDIALHPEAWQKRGEVGRQRVESLYSWDMKVEKAITLYQDLLKTK
jgi:glycosyltransferase involved in cell wall biosynthesis